MNIDRLIIELQKIQHEHGQLRVSSLPPKGAIPTIMPPGHIWNIEVVEYDWGKEVVIRAA